MRDDVSLCAHLRGERPALAIAPDGVLEWLDGPITAVARCVRCGGLALLELLDWSEDRRVRIYAAAGLDAEPLAVYRRNARGATCDPSRLDRETAALLACAGPVERLLALATDESEARASAPPPRGFTVSPASWQQRLPAPGDPTWFERLGLAKRAS